MRGAEVRRGGVVVAGFGMRFFAGEGEGEGEG